MKLRSQRLAACLMLAAACAMPSTALAEPVSATSGQEAKQLAELATGDQLVIEGFSGTLEFAGQPLALESFTGILGYSTEVAYAVVVEGRAQAGEQSASRGKMVMIAPFGQGVVSERFDAKRLHDALAASPRNAEFTTTMASLESLANRQNRGVFLGRLARTDFNVGTMGSASAEKGRRSRVGGIAARDARFSAPLSVTGSEGHIVAKFVQALAANDADRVSEFIDPLPFGVAASGPNGADVRRVAATRLLAQRNWSRLANFQTEKIGDTSWRVSGGGMHAQIELRRTSDFAFVQSIQVGE